eukprot:scaffold311840_cov17-Tisochrysis_lutea.AAC.1
MLYIPLRAPAHPGCRRAHIALRDCLGWCCLCITPVAPAQLGWCCQYIVCIVVKASLPACLPRLVLPAEGTLATSKTGKETQCPVPWLCIDRLAKRRQMQLFCYNIPSVQGLQPEQAASGSLTKQLAATWTSILRTVDDRFAARWAIFLPERDSFSRTCAWANLPSVQWEWKTMQVLAIASLEGPLTA